MNTQHGYRVLFGSFTNPDKTFASYGDAQRFAWDALREGSCVATVQVFVPCHADDGLPRWSTMEKWIIGASGNFKHLDA